MGSKLLDEVNFIALSAKQPLVRTQATHADNWKPLNTVNVLYIGASPEDHPPLNVERAYTDLEQKIVQRTKTSWIQRLQSLIPGQFRPRDIHIDKLFYATEKTLKEKLKERTYHVVCFAGHGKPDCIYLENMNANAEQGIHGKAVAFSAVNFMNLLENRGVRLVMLMACDTAQQKPGTALASFANELIKLGHVPAVIAMQTPIKDSIANDFTVGFFEQIARFIPIDVAFAESRKGIATHNRVRCDTIAPVLYLQTRNSNLFRQAINRLLWGFRLAVVFIIGLLFTLGGLQLWNNFQAQRQQRIADRNVALEAERGLQLAGQLTRIETVPTGANPDAPLLLENALWVSHSDSNTIQRVSLNGLEPTETITVGDEPRRPISDGRYVYTLNEGSSSVSRISTAAPYDVVDIFVSGSPEHYFSAFNALWVQSLSFGTLDRVSTDSDIAQSTFIDPAMHPAFAGNDYVWVLAKDEDYLYRIDPTALFPERFKVDGNITDGLFAQDALWLLVDNNRVVRYDPSTLDITTEYSLADEAVALHFYNDAFWIITGGNITHIKLFDNSTNVIDVGQDAVQITFIDEDVWVISDTNTTNTRSLLRLSAIDGMVLGQFEGLPPLTNFDTVISDTSKLWVTIPAENTVIAIDITSMVEVFRISPCEQPTRPAYDGTNLWFACKVEDQLASIPAEIIYVPTQRFQADQYEQTPIVSDNLLWFQQEAAGEVVIYDGTYQTILRRIVLENGLLPLQLAHDGSFWTAAPTKGIIYRLMPHLIPDSRFSVFPYPQLEVNIQSYHIDGEIHSFDLVDNRAWVRHTALERLQTTTNFTILSANEADSDQLIEFSSQKLGLVPTGFGDLGDDGLWIPASDINHGYIYQVDRNSGEILDTLQLPDTNFTAWTPFAFNHTIYFTAGAPPLDEAGTFVVRLFDLFGDLDGTAPLLYPYDTMTETWGEPLDIVNAPYLPSFDADYTTVWMTSSRTPILTRPTDADYNSGTVFARNLASGATLGPLSLCPYATPPSIAAEFAWVGCMDSPDMWLFRRDQLADAEYHYVATGIYPWSPLVIEENGKTLVWVSFRDSDSVALFDGESGERLQVMHVGQFPGPPFVFQGQVWVYNVGDGTVQRLTEMR